MPCFTLSQLVDTLQTQHRTDIQILNTDQEILFLLSQSLHRNHPYQTSQIIKEGHHSTLALNQRPIIQTQLEPEILHTAIETFLQQQLEHAQQINANLVVIDDIGVLIQGKSGVGKSLLTLNLIDRGAQMICDDITMIYTPDNSDKIYGFSPELLLDVLHIDQLPIMNLRHSHGDEAIASHHSIDFIVTLDSESTMLHQPFSKIDATQIYGTMIESIQLRPSDLSSTALMIEMLISDRKSRNSGYNTETEFQIKQSQLLKP